MPEQGPVTGEQLRVAAAALVHQLPECAVNNGLPDPGNLRKGHVQVVECEQAFPVRGSAKLFGRMRTAD